MDVYISADVEGVAGIVSWNQVTPGSDDYSIGRALMAAEVNAAIEGARLAGATRVVVNDSHGRMANLLPEAVDPVASLVTGQHKPMYMLQGLDESFDAAFFIGYHGAIGEPEAVLAHTYNPRAIWEAKVDDRIVGEIGINAMVCEAFGVPIRLVTGDQVATREARETVPSVHVAEVKRSYSRTSAEHLHPSTARQLIRREAGDCLQAVPKLLPVRRPHTVELTFLLADMASMAEWIRGVERIGARTVQYTSPDGLTAYQTFHTIITLTRTLAD